MEHAGLMRYTQQIKLEQMGNLTQKKLGQARVLCIGAGGLGATLLPYLAGAGIGTLGVVDADCVEEGNLHRQTIYLEQEIGQAKALCMQKKLQALNSAITVHAYEHRLDFSNAEDLISSYDLVADCSDNFSTRYLVHDWCFRLGKPYVYASASQFQGYCSLFYGKENPCLHCLFPIAQGGNCEQDGVLGTVPGLMGLVQATEIIKWIAQVGTPLFNRLLWLNSLTMEVKSIRLQKDEECPFCVHGQLRIEEMHCSGAGRENEVPPSHLAQFLQNHAPVLLLDVRTVKEHQQGNLGGAHIPLDELPRRLQELDPTQFILVYCQSGQRSLRALNILREAGFSSVYHLLKGLAGLK